MREDNAIAADNSARMNFQIAHVPFSRYGSYMAFSLRPATGSKGLFTSSGAGYNTLFLRTVHGDAPESDVFRVDLLVNGELAAFECAATATLLRLDISEGVYAEICFASPNAVRVRTQGCGLCLTLAHIGAYGFAQQVGEGVWHVNSWQNRRCYRLRCVRGAVSMDAPVTVEHCERIAADFVPASDGIGEAEITEFRVSPPPPVEASFDTALAQVRSEWEAWRKPGASDAQMLADYVCWASTVAPEGNFGRPAMLMSKNWMNQLWSWDHCFNAMALTRRHPLSAWDQLLLPFDGQDRSGALPDSSSDALRVWNFNKPPVHGWALRWMLERTDAVTPAMLAEFYPQLSDWTRWWLRDRDDDGDGVPQYNHGNDSGWDNSTAFDVGFPVEGPDLTAFLILQMDVLSDLAARLGKDDDAARWTADADALLTRLRTHFWRGDKFVATHSGDHATSDGDSLLLLLPLVLGKRLPDDMAAPLLAALREPNRFLTPYGPATESVASPFYILDGYWRGPMWAPPTMLLVDGLTRRGEHDLAGQLAAGFCRAFQQSGSAENFDALTGAGLRDRAYTWTASVYSVLTDEYLPPAPPK